MTREELLEVYGDLIDDNTEILMADGFDDAIIGLCSKSMRVIYDYDLMLEILEEEGMEEIEAIEHLEFNVLNAWVGDQTPIYMI
jgi:hypothetical protein